MMKDVTTPTAAAAAAAAAAAVSPVVCDDKKLLCHRLCHCCCCVTDCSDDLGLLIGCGCADIRVEFIQNTISFSNSKPDVPRTKVIFPNRVCWGFRLENNQRAPTVCPDIWEEAQADEEHSINAKSDHVPHAQVSTA